MNKKDIALTVGGVLATMVLAYLLYRLQQRDAATSAANAAADQQTQVSQANQQESYLAQLPSISSGVSGGGGTLATSNEGVSDTTASSGSHADAATETLLSNIIADFAGSINQTQPGASTNASLIPTTTTSSLNLSSIPISAAEALAGTSGVEYMPLVSSPKPTATLGGRTSVQS